MKNDTNIKINYEQNVNNKTRTFLLFNFAERCRQNLLQLIITLHIFELKRSNQQKMETAEELKTKTKTTSRPCMIITSPSKFIIYKNVSDQLNFKVFK